MIDLFYFGIGFIIYIFFNLITFEVYAKKKEITKAFVLFFIYVYYTILAGYTIYLVDFNLYDANIIEVVTQILVYVVAGGIYLLIYYESKIKKEDEKFF